MRQVCGRWWYRGKKIIWHFFPAWNETWNCIVTRYTREPKYTHLPVNIISLTKNGNDSLGKWQCEKVTVTRCMFIWSHHRIKIYDRAIIITLPILHTSLLSAGLLWMARRKITTSKISWCSQGSFHVLKTVPLITLHYTLVSSSKKSHLRLRLCSGLTVSILTVRYILPPKFCQGCITTIIL